VEESATQVDVLLTGALDCGLSIQQATRYTDAIAEPAIHR
jgi:hypothetical protein